MYLCISVLLLSYGSKRTWLTKLCSSWKPDMCSSKHFLSCVSLLLRHTGSDLDFKISLIYTVYTVYTVDLWSIHAVEKLTFLLEFNLAAFVSYLTISSLLCEFSKKMSSNRKTKRPHLSLNHRCINQQLVLACQQANWFDEEEELWKTLRAKGKSRQSASVEPQPCIKWLTNAARWLAVSCNSFMQTFCNPLIAIQCLLFSTHLEKRKGTMDQWQRAWSEWWSKCGSALSSDHTGQRCHKNSENSSTTGLMTQCMSSIPLTCFKPK